MGIRRSLLAAPKPACQRSKHKVEGPDLPRAMKRATLNRHTSQLSKAKGTHKSSQTRPVTKKTRFCIVSPLDTESSDVDEPMVKDPKDHESKTSVIAGDPQVVRPTTIPQGDKPAGSLQHDTSLVQPQNSQDEVENSKAMTCSPSVEPHRMEGKSSYLPEKPLSAWNEITTSLPSEVPHHSESLTLFITKAID
ncbi:hypothetical protein SCLCIDRAFT_33323 [Scleroderma citrinum Foug A]|uniref:Uncharacterized protein n=1 Tax=Scleroderma citrinum Foug A TaxID=1036808 RepID=A0A0C2YPD6_9AGAM|nr:hypothetical protein SCLCIDRAFT_33323 [Scleroderma citrinum Foug A]